jgi:hypothetical protein
MKIIVLAIGLFLVTATIVLAQENERNATENQRATSFITFENEATKKFDRDLKSNSLKIYLLGGIKSVIQKKDVEFEKQYTIQYYDFGCTPPANFKVYENYNLMVFNYLLKEHGEKWISFLNKNAFGFAKWKP